jgi:hypothetical protein
MGLRIALYRDRDMKKEINNNEETERVEQYHTVVILGHISRKAQKNH